jgi:outer membrane biosynthesis protein TonB
MEASRREYKRTALIIALIFLLGILLLLLLMSLKTANPPFEPVKLEMIELDFSGGGSSSSSSAASTNDQTSAIDQPDEPVVTADDPDSPVDAPEDPVTDGNSNTGNETSNDQSNTPANDFGNVFGGGNGGNGTNNNDGDRTGESNGPDIGSGTGSMGAGRDLISTPTAKNPIQEIGKVRVKIFVKRDGTVDKARTVVLYDDPKTTTPHKAHWDEARRLANKYKFETITGGKALEYKTIIITFRST